MDKNEVSKEIDDFIKEIDEIIAQKESENNNKILESQSIKEYADFIIEESELDISKDTVINAYNTRCEIEKKQGK